MANNSDVCGIPTLHDMQLISEVMKLDPSLFSKSRNSTTPQSGGASAAANILAMGVILAGAGASFAAVNYFLTNPTAIAASGIMPCGPNDQIPSWLLTATGLVAKTCAQRQAEFDIFMASVLAKAQLAATAVGGITIANYTALTDAIDGMIGTCPTNGRSSLLQRANAAAQGGKRKNNQKSRNRKSRNRKSRKNNMNRK